MTSDDPRVRAIDLLGQLQACLQRAEPERHASLAQQAEELARSVETFHMEAIRFRLYGLRRQLTTHADTFPAGATELLAQATQALEAAGFQVK